MKSKVHRKQEQSSSQLIVVDADVLRSASASDAGPPRGSRCRELLRSILDICHRAVVSPALSKEYDQHASRYAMRWRVAMTQRNKMVHTSARHTGRSRGWLRTETLDDARRAIAQKDMHLVLSAREAGAVILSADDRARGVFAEVADLRSLGWASALTVGVEWLERGAPSTEVRLGGDGKPPRPEASRRRGARGRGQRHRQ